MIICPLLFYPLRLRTISCAQTLSDLYMYKSSEIPHIVNWVIMERV